MGHPRWDNEQAWKAHLSADLNCGLTNRRSNVLPNLLLMPTPCEFTRHIERSNPMVARIGKQAPCPCKSGLKFGDCHGLAPEPFVNTLDQVKGDPIWDAMVAAGVPFEGVLPSLLCEGKRLRFVGGKLFRRRPEETFHEFVFALLRGIVGIHWLQNQRKLPIEQQHQICRWFEATDAFLQLHRSKLVGEDETHFSADAPGDVSDLLTLAPICFIWLT